MLEVILPVSQGQAAVEKADAAELYDSIP